MRSLAAEFGVPHCIASSTATPARSTCRSSTKTTDIASTESTPNPSFCRKLRVGIHAEHRTHRGRHGVRARVPVATTPSQKKPPSHFRSSRSGPTSTPSDSCSVFITATHSGIAARRIRFSRRCWSGSRATSSRRNGKMPVGKTVAFTTFAAVSHGLARHTHVRRRPRLRVALAVFERAFLVARSLHPHLADRHRTFFSPRNLRRARRADPVRARFGSSRFSRDARAQQPRGSARRRWHRSSLTARCLLSRNADFRRRPESNGACFGLRSHAARSPTSTWSVTFSKCVRPRSLAHGGITHSFAFAAIFALVDFVRGVSRASRRHSRVVEGRRIFVRVRRLASAARHDDQRRFRRRGFSGRSPRSVFRFRSNCFRRVRSVCTSTSVFGGS